jgi:hypothetical protein
MSCDPAEYAARIPDDVAATFMDWYYGEGSAMYRAFRREPDINFSFRRLVRETRRELAGCVHRPEEEVPRLENALRWAMGGLRLQLLQEAMDKLVLKNLDVLEDRDDLVDVAEQGWLNAQVLARRAT